MHESPSRQSYVRVWNLSQFPRPAGRHRVRARGAGRLRGRTGCCRSATTKS